MTKTGQDHLDSLRDGRSVYLNGQLVGDVVDHPAYRNAIRSTAGLYDFQAASENRELMTFESPTGARVNRCWQMPESYDDLVQRRRALEAWAEQTNGFLGRSPDHVASSLCGMMMRLDLFQAHGAERAKAFSDYFEYVRDNDRFVTYVVVSPQADRSKGVSGQADEFLTAGICDEDSQGITVKGAKMLGTSCILANEVLLGTIQPMQPGEEKYAFSASIPLGTKGVKLLSRKSYEAAAVSEFDNPLSSRFDENDAVVYFDEVKVPWDRVFVHRDPSMCRAQYHETPAHVFHNYQAQVRLMVKLRFLVGVARKIAETTNVLAYPQVVESLGALAGQVGLIEGMVYGMEAKGTYVGKYYVPDRHLMYASQVQAQQMYPEVIQAIRQLAGGGVIMLPSGAVDFASPEIAGYIEKTQQSPVMDSKDRVKLFKLAWDAIGSEFGSRHTQYEMFYAGAQFAVRNHSYRTYDWEKATGLVDRFMDSYDLPG